MTILTLEMVRARTRRWKITVVDDNGPINLTGKTLYFTGKTKLSDADVDAVFKKLTGAGIVNLVAADGTATVTLTPADTLSLAIKEEQMLHVDLVLKDGTDQDALVGQGTLTVFGNVTRDIV